MNCNNNILNFSNEEAKEFIASYMESMDESEAAFRILSKRNPDIKIDERIAGIFGRHVLLDRKVNKKIGELILKKKVNPEQLKIDVYKLSKADDSYGKGRTKLGALGLLGKWLCMEQPT
ncbi:hypothetical protein KKH36_01895, partial [Patescibacteria group bacterium]|nr:hypothetical protein [Patescibacteria group bacterium]